MDKNKTLSPKLCDALQCAAEEFSPEHAAEKLKIKKSGFVKRLERARERTKSQSTLGAYRKALVLGCMEVR